MRRLIPPLALLGLMLAGCAGDNGPSTPGDQVDASLHQATVEVEGMH
jgi:hypothetical protein